MKLASAFHQYIYSFNYNVHHTDLCRLESRQVFGEEVENKLLFSNLEVDPSISPFIKSRFDIHLLSEDYSALLENVKQQNIHFEGFKVEYLVLDGDETPYKERLNKLRDIGYRIEGEPNYDSPTIVYGISFYENIWYFGVLIKHNAHWQKHNEKPFKFSNSISINIAKSLVSSATKGSKTTKLLDACCGVGTIMLEACIAGIDIEGCDINWKACKNTTENLTYYSYTAEVYHSDIKDLTSHYDTAIVDLPYNHTTYSDDGITAHIIETVAKLTSRLVIVSIADIESIIINSGLKVTDFCTVEKRGKSKFTRNIWVCEG